MPGPEPGKKYTYADYLTWDDGKRWELIDGVPYEMEVGPDLRGTPQKRTIKTPERFESFCVKEESPAMSSPVPKPDERYTYEDYLSWDDGKRWELINGVAYDMSPAPRPEHQSVAQRLVKRLSDFLDDKPCQVFFAPLDVKFLFEDGTLDAIVQPDILVICDETKLDNRGCNGAPDLVIEILSERTAGYDMVEKRELYERNRVPEYWIANPWDGTISVYRVGENGKYGTPRYFTREQVLETASLPGLKIDLSNVFVKR